MRPFAFLASVVSGGFAALGAAALSQLPEFVQQYMQRLGGHRDEARRAIDVLSRTITDPANPARMAIEARLTHLNEALSALEQSQGLERIITFFGVFDPDIARATSQVFRPAVPLTIDGLLCALVGLLVGVIVFQACAGVCKRGWHAVKKPFAKKPMVAK